MFETPEFRQYLRDEFYKAGGYSTEETTIISYLQNLAVENERDPSFVRRPEDQAIVFALQSARELISQALVYKRQRGDDLLTLGDIQKAYQALFCSVWPFCK